MYEGAATLLVGALYLYGIAGLVFATAFVTTGVKRIDSQAIGSVGAAQPMQIHGKVTQIGNSLLLETESSAVASRSFRNPPKQGPPGIPVSG